jgi:hypothetical protein
MQTMTVLTNDSIPAIAVTSTLKLCGTNQVAPTCTATSVVTEDGTYTVVGNTITFMPVAGFLGAIGRQAWERCGQKNSSGVLGDDLEEGGFHVFSFHYLNQGLRKVTNLFFSSSRLHPAQAGGPAENGGKRLSPVLVPGDLPLRSHRPSHQQERKINCVQIVRFQDRP